jgi:formyl-CoA transferase
MGSEQSSAARIGDVAEVGDVRPLDGVRVLTLENYVAAPLATMLLADWGADVVKIEPPNGDAYRRFPPVTERDGHRTSASFARINRNKRSVVLDVRTDAGRDSFLRLVEHADVVVENLRPGTLDRIGIGYRAMRTRNPRIVVVSLSGFGQPDVRPGPFIERPALDLVGQAVSGLSYAVGGEGEQPHYLGLPLVDTATADWGAIATLLGLTWRDRTGRGQHLDISMYDVAMHLNEYNLGYFGMFKRNPPRGRMPSSAPFDYFRAEDGWYALAISGEGTWERLSTAIGHPELAQDPSLADGTRRADVVESRLRPLIEEWSSRMPVDKVCEALSQYDVPASPAHQPSDVFDCGHAAARRAWVDVPDPALGAVRVVANPVKSDQMPADRLTAPPQLGADTEEVLRTWTARPGDGSEPA